MIAPNKLLAASLIWACSVLPATEFSDAGAFSASLNKAADYVVRLQGVDLNKLDIGLWEETPSGVRVNYVTRAQSRIFFEKQKKKEMVLVEYMVVALSGDLLGEEIDRTINYFKGVGYRRIVLIKYTNQGVSILHDSSGEYVSGFYVKYP